MQFGWHCSQISTTRRTVRKVNKRVADWISSCTHKNHTVHVRVVQLLCHNPVTNLCFQPNLVLICPSLILNLNQVSLWFVDELNLHALWLKSVRLFFTLGSKDSLPGKTTIYVCTHKGQRDTKISILGISELFCEHSFLFGESDLFYLQQG